MDRDETLSKIRFLINYDTKKTLSENYILEVNTIGCKCIDGTYSEKCCGSKSDWTGPQSQYVIQTKERGERGNYSNPTIPASWDHETSSYLELGLLVGGVILELIPLGVTQVVGGVMIAASLAIGVTDALVYFGEDDPYMGTMMLALQLIPGGELVTILKKSPKFVKYGDDVVDFIKNNTPETITRLIKTSKSGKESLTTLQKRVISSLREGAEEVTPELVKTFAKKVLVVYRTKLLGLSLSSLLGFLMKVLGWTGTTVIKILGVAITVDKLWTLYTTPESYRKKMRDKASFSKIMDSLYAGTLDDQIIEGLWAIYQKLFDKDGNVNTTGQEEIKKILIDNHMTDEEVTKIAEKQGLDLDIKTDYKDYLQKLKSKFLVSGPDFDESQQNTAQPLTLQGLIDGKYTLRKGQKGDIVREIQKMLVALDYDLGTSGKNKDGVDGDFATKTFDAIVDFQIDNDLVKFDGIIGSETAKRLKKLYDEKSE